ncbi:RHS repeat domain-containing protein [Apibacter adventoris]|uniref:RHS repeat-associated core domain-containing protein n=1 Tax=Apibacter adventoris TaxID=1679466 RepID=A0A2S8AFM8_9FLAO|nr:RHS repeat-associated core domain-containing protein [Apibacter adventoris]PQL94857.1 hypothetical protein C4S77_02420 [Apibacter adventoris]
MEERNQSWNTPYLFNGKEQDEKTRLYYYGARYYNPRESIFLSVDTMFEKTMTPYQYTYQNPIRFTDPTGMKGEDEFDEKGNKISNLGGDKIDFYHQKDGSTKVVDRESGESNIITGGKSLIQGYTYRKKSTSWWTLFKEFDKGEGPTKSMFADFEDSTLGIFG